MTEDKPFNEYWALKALREVYRGHCKQLDDARRALLQRRMHELGPGVDRSEQIRKLLRDCRRRNGGTMV